MWSTEADSTRATRRSIQNETIAHLGHVRISRGVRGVLPRGNMAHVGIFILLQPQVASTWARGHGQGQSVPLMAFDTTATYKHHDTGTDSQGSHTTDTVNTPLGHSVLTPTPNHRWRAPTPLEITVGTPASIYR